MSSIAMYDDEPLSATERLLERSWDARERDASEGELIVDASMAHESACLELRRCSGTQFDPAVVDAFITVMQTRPDEREADRARQAAAHVRALLNGSSAPAPREAIRV